ncbi:transcriptional regulator with XRE-family HTH domain [Azospirillum lipoferum]|uniref:Helix-turn-helix domain-containing protein n=1 Tax=Azospirillum lipoferum TaxID=193 RepID=A0A5A9GPY9_AZOLI|nr:MULTISPECIES: helix-turn-helix transcriptional regulator [Azospirillum]KAA0595359.1 helix-turn-helix domain-containing protein [Azospirillum lipoferum]MCP1611749.1 transcriptional regulator with XRE-family HTH domain [Azospirillum lipoferum]MDW5533493.1 helix-turn-helix transcriptional regulator [Azospirillum sp. NL1]
MQTDSKQAGTLAAFLRDRRTRLDPAAFGFTGRRRTPGLRREEVAQRANISPTWYTWLEQGRGGAPSADVLDRIASGLMLTDLEREHLFILALGRPPEMRYRPVQGVSPRLQRLLDSFDACPAFIKTATWDVLAWNQAAAVVLTDYATLLPEQRNILRLVFGNPAIRAKQKDWEGMARHLVGAFRVDAARAGAVKEIADLVEELCRTSADFARFWNENDVYAPSEGVKQLQHPALGAVEMEYSAFAVDGRPDLGLLVYNPLDEQVKDRIRAMVAQRTGTGKGGKPSYQRPAA